MKPQVQSTVITAPRARRDILASLPRDRITLDLDATDIRDALKMLAAKARVNLIYGAEVSGSVNLHLVDVPFHEAFGLILSMNKLVAAQVGENILRIASPAVLQKERAGVVGMTRIFPLRYGSAAEVKTQIDAVRTAEGRTGSTVVDTRNNSLIVTEAPEGLAATERLLVSLDARPKQVLIEAKLVEVKLSKDFHVGIQWDFLSQMPSGQQGGQRRQQQRMPEKFQITPVEILRERTRRPDQ
jgi:type II secretory pathway component HofQ